MPEGPEVRSMTGWLQSQIPLDSALVNLAVDPKYHSRIRGNLPDFALLEPMLKKITCHGKKTFMTFETITGPIVCQISYGMSGGFASEPARNTRATFDFGDRQVYFVDARKFGMIQWQSEEETQQVLSHLGIDVFDPSFVFNWSHMLHSKKIQDLPVCQFLMSQSWIAGVGNYIKAEALYQARIHPEQTIGTLNYIQRVNLVRALIDICDRSFEAQGHSFLTYKTPDGGTGSFKMQVYGKELDPNGAPVVKTQTSDGRTTHWVPSLQVLNY